MSTLKNVTALALAGMLIGLGVILGFYKIPITSFIEIRFQSIPVDVAGMLLGPFFGGTVGILTDVLSYFVHPTGAFFPGFTITQMATGIIFAIFLYKKPFSFGRVAAAETLTTGLCGILLNSLWLSILYKAPYIATLVARLPKELIMLPINIVILCLVAKAVSKISAFFLQMAEK